MRCSVHVGILRSDEENCGSTNKQIRGRKALEQRKCVVVVNFFCEAGAFSFSK